MMSTADMNFPRTQHCLTLAWPLHTLPTLLNLYTLHTLNHAAFFAYLSGCLLQYSLSLSKPM